MFSRMRITTTTGNSCLLALLNFALLPIALVLMTFFIRNRATPFLADKMGATPRRSFVIHDDLTMKWQRPPGKTAR
jgi:hypothetical protein